MALHTVKEKGGVFYFFSVHPEDFALGVYTVVMSFLAANVLWVYALMLCLSLNHVNLVRTVDRLIGIQIIFALITTFLWWMIYSEKGRNAVTHINFYTWFVAKIIAVTVEVVFLPQTYLKVASAHFTPRDLNSALVNATCGAVFVMVVEFCGMFLAHKYFKDVRGRNRRFRTSKAYIEKAFSV